MDRVLIHTAQIITPDIQTDSRGNQVRVYDPDVAEVLEVKCWLQQNQSNEAATEGRDPLIRKWAMICRLPSDHDFNGRERVVWLNAPGGEWTFEIFGPTEPTYTRRGYHHHEINLRRTDG